MEAFCQNYDKTQPKVTLKKCVKGPTTWSQEIPKDKPFTRLSNKVWLHDRPEAETYEVLIDAYRLRVLDDKNAGISINQNSLDFSWFLGIVHLRPGLLPPWWTLEKTEACEALGRDSSHWCNLRTPVTKSKIIQHYGEATFPMQLRIFVEQVRGSGPGGQSGKAMLSRMVQREAGEIKA